MSTAVAIGVSVALAFTLSWAGARFVIGIAHRAGLQDIPNARSSHTNPTPRGGGVGIVAGTLVATVLALFFVAAGASPAGHAQVSDSSVNPDWGTVFGHPFWAGITAAIGLAAVGLADDLCNLSRRSRFAAQAACAAAVLLSAGIASPFSGVAGLLIFAAVLFAGVWWINLYNFMDGIDGIAAMQALFMLSAAMLSGPAANDVPTHPVDVFGLMLLAATLGFLGLNWAPAKVFMGDAGSLFLGVSILFIATDSVTRGYTTPWFWLIVAGMFVSDATATLLKRLLRRTNVTTAHRSHLYQQLARRWGSHAKVTLVYLLLNLMWFFPMALLSQHWQSWGPAVTALACLPALGLCWILGAGEPESTSRIEQ